MQNFATLQLADCCAELLVWWHVGCMAKQDSNVTSATSSACADSFIASMYSEARLRLVLPCDNETTTCIQLAVEHTV
jgi:hypothetical protein